MRWQLLLLVGSRIGGSLLTSLSMLAFASAAGLLRSLFPLPPSRFGLLAGLTQLTGPPFLLSRAVQDAWVITGKSFELCLLRCACS